MDEKEYKFLKESEGSWWYFARVFFVRRMMLGVSLLPHGRILDFGAGYGGMHSFLKEVGPVDALEVEKKAADACVVRGYEKVASKLEELESGAYRLVGAFDVVEHVADDATVLCSIHSLLLPGGLFVATVPAFSFLWSEHDVLNHHFRRYTVPQMKKLFLDAGFQEVRATYWNMVLFPVAYLLRLVGKGGGEALTPHPVVNRILLTVLKIESWAVPHAVVPFGTGIVITGRKVAEDGVPVLKNAPPKLTWRTFVNPVFVFASLCNTRFTHFFFVGTAGALLNIGLTWFFVKFFFGTERYLDAFIIGIVGNLLFNFTLNSIVTFKTKKQHIPRFVYFVAYSLLMAEVQYYTVKVITSFVGLQWFLLVIAGVILGYAVLNFLVFKYVIFREKSERF